MNKDKKDKLVKKALLLVAIICVGIALSLTSKAQQNQMIERTTESEIKEKNAVVAKRNLQEQMTEKVSEDLIKEIIGENKFNRNRTAIATKIIKNSSRFIPFSKMGELKPTENGYKMALTLKISVDALQKMLMDQGLFYETDGTPVLIPFVKYTDRVNLKEFSWWFEKENISTNVFLKKLNVLFEKQLKTALGRVSFYSIRPLTLRYQNEKTILNNLNPQLSAVELQNLANTFSAEIILFGEIQFFKSTERMDSYKLDISLTAMQASNNRIIAQLSRQFVTDAGAFEPVVEKKWKEVSDAILNELSNQILEAWQKGSIGASLYKLVIDGRIPIPQQEGLKVVIQSKTREIKNIRERMVSADKIVFEIDSTISTKEIASRLKEIEFGGIKVVLDEVDDAKLVYKLSK